MIPAELAGTLAIAGAASRVTFGSAPDADMRWEAGWLWWRGERLAARDEVRLRGPHNAHNAMAAAAVALESGLPAEGVRAALASFAGVAHRLEEVARRDGVLYVNDSKGTNVASTLVALRSFEPASVHVILGGRGKGEDFGALADAVRGRARAVYLIGEARRRDRRGARPRGCGRADPDHGLRDARGRGRGRRRGGGVRARSCCSARPARAMTSSATSRSAGRSSSGWCSAPERRRGGRLFALAVEAPMMASVAASSGRPQRPAEPIPRTSPQRLPIEHSLLLTATLCLLAGGAVMVYSASAPAALTGGTHRRREHARALRRLRRDRPAAAAGSRRAPTSTPSGG